MPKLIIQDNLKIKQPVVIPFKEGSSAADMLESKFKSIDLNKATLHINDTQVFANNHEALLSPLKNGDSVTLSIEVKGFIGDIIDFALDITGVGAALGFLQDLFTPELPGGQETSSPNNSLTSQKNIIRAYAQKALVCGSPSLYPDLIGEPIEYYQGNIKYSESYFYANYGTLNGGTVQAGETDIIRFAGATSNFYYPTAGITTIPNYRVGQEVDEIDGQTLKGTNEGEDGATISCTESATTTTYTGTTFIIYLQQDTDSDNLKAQFDAGNKNVEIQYGAFITDEPSEPPAPSRPTGTGNITSMALSGSEYTVTVENFNGDKSETAVYYDPYVFTIKLDNTLGPFTNPTQCEKMFFNIAFTRGLKATAPIEVIVYELDSKGGTRTGVSETFTAIYTSDEVDAQYRTFEINIANGRSWYEWTIQRTNGASQATDKPDIPTLEKSFCIKELGSYDFKNATMLKTVMNSTQTPTSSGVDNKINIVNGQVEMPSYDKSTGAVLANAPSRNLADAVMFVWSEFHGLDLSLLDLDELYTIVDGLPSGFKTFDYTFDDTSVSVGEKLDIILNVGRIQKYWDGKKVRFWRDEKVNFNSAMLSRADIASESERSYSVSRSSFVAGEYDSVQVEYVNREINKKAYIYRSFDSVGNIINVSGSNPKTVNLIGCQDELNAINRAELEIRRMLYQRWNLSDTFMDSQRFLGKGDVVLYNEVYEGGSAFGGEIQAVSAGAATVREELNLNSGTSYYVYYTNMHGDVIGPQVLTGFTSNSFTCADLSEAYVYGDEDSQIGSRYYITEVNDSINRQWRVINRESSGYNVQVDLVNYDERIYEYDTI